MHAKKGKGILVFMIILALVVGGMFYMKNRTGKSLSIDRFNEVDATGCILDRCECECYPSEYAPEINLGKVCTQDCKAWKNIDRCERQGNTCVKIMKTDSGLWTAQVFFRDNRYVPTQNIRDNPRFLEYTSELVTDSSDKAKLGMEIWVEHDNDRFIYLYNGAVYEIWEIDNTPFE